MLALFTLTGLVFLARGVQTFLQTNQFCSTENFAGQSGFVLHAELTDSFLEVNVLAVALLPITVPKSTKSPFWGR